MKYFDLTIRVSFLIIVGLGILYTSYSISNWVFNYLLSFNSQEVSLILAITTWFCMIIIFSAFIVDIIDIMERKTDLRLFK